MECNNVFPKHRLWILPFSKSLSLVKIEFDYQMTITAEHTKEIWIRTTGRYHLLAQYEKPAEITTKWKQLLIPDHIASNFYTSI